MAEGSSRPQASAMNTIPISERPPYGPLFSKVFFPILFNLGILGINSVQFCALPLLLIPWIGRGMFEAVIDWTKDSFGRLLILITVLFAPTSLHITSDPHIPSLVERNAQGGIERINLPDRLVIMANHQAYMDWMYMWILACYAGRAEGLTILLKWNLRHIPFIGWGMRFFRFIFLRRSWVADRANLTQALTRLGDHAKSSSEKGAASSLGSFGTSDNGSNIKEERQSLLSGNKPQSDRSPLWLLIFPEGTITSDEERSKSVKYANKEGIPDLVASLHPRSTGLLFCLRTLLPQIPDLQLLDVTIGYPGVPLGKYPQDYYGLGSVFWKSVPPPTVHIHINLHSDLSTIPSLRPAITPDSDQGLTGTVEGSQAKQANEGIATPAEAREFELWLRKVWKEKDERLKVFAQPDVQKFGDRAKVEVIRIRQTRWYHWASAFGAGGIGTVIIVGKVLKQAVIG